MAMAPSKNGIILKELTIYIRILFFQRVQLIVSIPENWKFIIEKNEIGANLITHDHHVI